MIESLAQHRPGVHDALVRIDRELGPRLAAVNRWGDDLRGRLLDFAGRGKLIRGSLVAACAGAFGVPPSADTCTVGAVLELIQSFLLIHDDIMDEDPVRRGRPAVYEQYRVYAEESGFRRPRRFGESMGVCGGDVAVLMAFAAFGLTGLPPATQLEMVRLLALEIADVGVAQMGDVANGHRADQASEEEIVSVYRFKTGRYTFSLPLLLGAIAAGASEDDRSALSAWGEIQGVIFQVRDDYLGVMGDTEEIGKPAGSDVAADKQTLQRRLLFERLERGSADDVRPLFGKGSLEAGELERVRTALRTTGVLDELEARVKEMRGQASRYFDQLTGVSSDGRAFLRELETYNAGRVI